VIGAVLVLIFFALKWGDVVEYVSGEPRIKAGYQRQLQKKLEKEDRCEQYALIAIANGWYPCLHSGLKMYYLKKGEVWKYGTTGKGETGRYTTQFLRTNNVSYEIEFVGSENECKKQEQRKLHGYPILPENLARPEEYRLIRPPYNPILR
jgi:hypothetical protein